MGAHIAGARTVGACVVRARTVMARTVMADIMEARVAAVQGAVVRVAVVWGAAVLFVVVQDVTVRGAAVGVASVRVAVTQRERGVAVLVVVVQAGVGQQPGHLEPPLAEPHRADVGDRLRRIYLQGQKSVSRAVGPVGQRPAAQGVRVETVEREPGIGALNAGADTVLFEVGVPAAGTEVEGREGDRDAGIPRTRAGCAERHPPFLTRAPSPQDQAGAVRQRLGDGQTQGEDVRQGDLRVDDDHTHRPAPSPSIEPTLRLP
ncbi:hypothetical protein GCM10027612_04050 [Microbispora bryophytorum subsp. camponoti]